MFIKTSLLVLLSSTFIIMTSHLAKAQGDVQSLANPSPVNIKLLDSTVMIRKRILHDERILLAGNNYTKEPAFHQELILFFGENSADLNPDLPLNRNPLTLQKMEQFTEFLEKGWPIKNIEINGYSSPEGPADVNERLSKERAIAGENYIRKMISNLQSNDKSMMAKKRLQDNIQYDIHGSGEDWDGLVKSLEAFNIKEKDTLEAIIRSQQDAGQREQEIKKMTEVYREVEDKILPGLRRVSIIVYCYEPKKTDAEILDLSSSHPEDLTYHELLYAATLTGDTAARLKVYEFVSFHFPYEWEAFNNTAYCYLQEGNTAGAVVYLNKALNLFPGNGITLNNFAAAALKNNDPEKAATYASLAEREGIDESYNKGILSLERGHYQEAATLFRDLSCNSNAALAALMIGDTARCRTLVTCAPSHAEKFYLMAILAARQGDAPSFFKNLARACAMNPFFKEMARDDPEFGPYKDKPEFIKLISSGNGGS
jgi:tetratricopeptide (TPR) repeat protein